MGSACLWQCFSPAMEWAIYDGGVDPEILEVVPQQNTHIYALEKSWTNCWLHWGHQHLVWHKAIVEASVGVFWRNHWGLKPDALIWWWCTCFVHSNIVQWLNLSKDKLPNTLLITPCFSTVSGTLQNNMNHYPNLVLWQIYISVKPTPLSVLIWGFSFCVHLNRGCCSSFGTPSFSRAIFSRSSYVTDW